MTNKYKTSSLPNITADELAQASRTPLLTEEEIFDKMAADGSASLRKNEELIEMNEEDLHNLIAYAENPEKFKDFPWRESMAPMIADFEAKTLLEKATSATETKNVLTHDLAVNPKLADFVTANGRFSFTADELAQASRTPLLTEEEIFDKMAANGSTPSANNEKIIARPGPRDKIHALRPSTEKGIALQKNILAMLDKMPTIIFTDVKILGATEFQAQQRSNEPSQKPFPPIPYPIYLNMTENDLVRKYTKQIHDADLKHTMENLQPVKSTIHVKKDDLQTIIERGSKFTQPVSRQEVVQGAKLPMALLAAAAVGLFASLMLTAHVSKDSVSPMVAPNQVASIGATAQLLRTCRLNLPSVQLSAVSNSLDEWSPSWLATNGSMPVTANNELCTQLLGASLQGPSDADAGDPAAFQEGLDETKQLMLEQIATEVTKDQKAAEDVAPLMGLSPSDVQHYFKAVKQGSPPNGAGPIPEAGPHFSV